MFYKTRVYFAALAAGIIIPSAAFMASDSGISANAAGSFSVTDYGAVAGDGKDDLEAINNAITAANEAGGGVVTMPSGDFTIELGGMGGNGYGIEMKSNVTLQMNKNTKLNVVPNSFDNYEVIRIKGMSNVSVTGGQILGDKNKHKSSGGEDGHGVVVKDSDNVNILNMTIKNCWGDGIYIGNLVDNGTGGKNVTIKNCTIASNRRNNIGIIHGTNITIDKCKIKKAKGAQPQSGINIEPNTDGGNLASSQICRNINIKNTTVTCVKMGVDNNYFALQIMNPYFQSNNHVVAEKVNITNCNLGGDVGNYAGKKVTLKKTKIKGTFYDHMGTKIKKGCSIGNHYKF